MSKEFKLDEKLKRLENTIEKLDKGDTPLDEMISLYQEGIENSKEIRVYLEKAEQKIIDISKEFEENEVED